MTRDEINHPPHYQGVCKCTECGADVEAIQITERHGFVRGNALKYLLRAGKKGDALMDLEKARWYLDREIAAVLDRDFDPDADTADLFASPVPARKFCDDAPVSYGPAKLPAETLSDALYWMRDREAKK